MPVRRASLVVLAYPYARCSCRMACVHDLPGFRVGDAATLFVFVARMPCQQPAQTLMSRETKSRAYKPTMPNNKMDWALLMS
jgi:hypothetical protein